MTFQDLWSEYFTGSYSFGNGNTRLIKGNVAIIKTVFEKIPDSIIVESTSQFLLTDSIFSGGQSDSIKSTAQGIVLLRNCFTNINIKNYIVKLDCLGIKQSLAHIRQTSFSSSSSSQISSGGSIIESGALFVKAQHVHTSNCNVTKITAGAYIGIKIDETIYGSHNRYNVFHNNYARDKGIASLEEGGGIILDSIFTNNRGNEAVFYAIGSKGVTMQNCVFNGNTKEGNLFFVSEGSFCYAINCYIQAFNDANKDRTPYYINKLQSVPQISTNFAHNNGCSVRLITKEVLCRTENKSGLKITSIVFFSCFCLIEKKV